MDSTSQPNGDNGAVDVLIVGAGPAGLMLSLYLSEMGISHRTIDQRGTRALNGRADGFHVRTVEIWDSFGMAHRLQQHGNHFGEWALWTSDPHSHAITLQRYEPGVGEADSRQRTATFGQGYIEATMIEAIKQRGGPIVERGSQAIQLKHAVEAGHPPYASMVTVRRLQSSEREAWPTNAHYRAAEGTIEAAECWTEGFGTDLEDITPRSHGLEGTTVDIRAKYVVGADGAHSWVRHQLPGFAMEGASSDSVWGVMDIVPITDFPDIRRNCTILASSGTILLIPRERGLVRFYIQLPEDESTARTGAKASAHDPEMIKKMFAIAQRSFAPYQLDYRYCDWWTVYTVGQRVCNQFSQDDRIFLVGDAVHTHTPKGGQGMNTSQQDAYNLAWKLGGVLRGELPRTVLSTYASERRPIAQGLIALDTDMAKVLTARSTVPIEEVQRVYNHLRYYGSGVHLRYAPNCLVAGEAEAGLASAKNLTAGARAKDVTIFHLASATPMSLLSVLPSKGCWYLLAFGGDVLRPHQKARVDHLGSQLLAFQQAKPASENVTKPLSIRNVLVLPNSISDVHGLAFHEAFASHNKLGGRDYDSIYTALPSRYEAPHQSPTTGAGDEAYESLGIDKTTGALCLVRPDQVVSWIGGIDDAQQLFNWISAFSA